jgi:hypothetical protein
VRTAGPPATTAIGTSPACVPVIWTPLPVRTVLTVGTVIWVPDRRSNSTETPVASVGAAPAPDVPPAVPAGDALLSSRPNTCSFEPWSMVSTVRRIRLPLSIVSLVTDSASEPPPGRMNLPVSVASSFSGSGAPKSCASPAPDTAMSPIMAQAKRSARMI